MYEYDGKVMWNCSVFLKHSTTILHEPHVTEICVVLTFYLKAGGRIYVSPVTSGKKHLDTHR